MPIIPNLSAHRSPTRMNALAEEDDFVAWPYIDSLYDYTQVLGHPLAKLPLTELGSRVAVIGGGAAGIVAALELLRMGLRPVIYEGSGRIGGRNWSKRFSDEQAIAELGAMRVPPENRVFFYYANLLDMQTAPFPDPGKVQTTLFYKGRTYSWAPGTLPPAPFDAIQATFEGFVTPLRNRLWDPWRRGDMASVQKVWQEYIDKYSTMSFYEGVQQGTGWNQEQMTAFGALGLGSGGFGPLFDISFLDIFRLLINQLETNQEFFAGGISTLTEGMYNMKVKVGAGPVSLAEINALHQAYATTLERQGDSHWQITDSKGETRSFEAVILATTTREMEVIGMTLPSSPLPQDVQTAIRDLHMMESSKLFIRTQTKFWKTDPSVPSNIQTDQLPRGVYCLDYPQTDYGVVLISYTWGDDSSKLMAYRDAQQRFELLRSVIATIDPKFASYLKPVGGEIIMVDWQLEPHYLGAFKLNLPGQEAEVQSVYYQFLTSLNAETDNGLYLAGDGVSWTGGWTEGALQTGINAAAAVAQHLGGTPIPNGPLTQKPLYVYPPAVSKH
ncbi:MAG TPA: NAD(P)/FAD-dependent oxidoreductase [Longimicrobiaceae bacterium]|nr:NAD(P)/FAD-dependent oxidoreductase [Longimicrobiaceae bacterium]